MVMRIKYKKFIKLIIIDKEIKNKYIIIKITFISHMYYAK